MMNDQFGIINDMLLRLGLIDQPIAWTATADTAMVAVLIVDIWKTTPFMALLILAGLQMMPRDIYEAARIDGIHPVKVFFRVTLPLIRPALMVAVIFRGLDALRIFDLIYVLTPNSERTMTMSVIARQNLFDFDKFAYGSAASTFLFLIIALITIFYIWVGRVNLGGRQMRLDRLFKRTLFYAARRDHRPVRRLPLLLRHHHLASNPARRSSASTTARSRYRLANYVAVMTQGNFARNILNSLIVVGSGRRHLAAPRRHRRLCARRACASAAALPCSSSSWRCRCSRRSRCWPACSS